MGREIRRNPFEGKSVEVEKWMQKLKLKNKKKRFGMESYGEEK